jgi:hypothetical protein
MRYNVENLYEYCNEKEIKLTNDYTKLNINRESYLEGKCKNEDCDKNFCKDFRQLVKTGPFCLECLKNKNSNKIKSIITENNYKLLKKFCEENSVELLEDYSNIFINRDTLIKGKCKTENCIGIFEKSLRSLFKHKDYCYECCKELGKEKGKNTFIEKYGYNHPMKNKDYQNKCKNNILEKYGVSHISKLEKIKNQKKEKSIEKYGVEYPLQCPEIRKQIIATNKEKYGCENPMQNAEIREKVQKTVQQRYGVNYASQDSTIKDKIVETFIKNYGVSHHLQNAESAEKHLHATFKTKQYTLPCGKIIDYQGYENFAFDELLLKEKIDENDLITNRKDVPEIWYLDKNGKNRRHYVDIYLHSQNKCIEVKSCWTNQSKNNVLEKKEYAEKLGYLYEIWIYDKKGNKTIL